MTSRVGMRCHTTAAHVSKPGVQRSLGLPECPTPPEEAYELAAGYRRELDAGAAARRRTLAHAA